MTFISEDFLVSFSMLRIFKKLNVQVILRNFIKMIPWI